MKAAWATGCGGPADSDSPGPPPQGTSLLFPELSGPGLNLAGAHGLLIFSIPGCYTTFHLKNAFLPHQRARLSRERSWVSWGDPPRSGLGRVPVQRFGERGDRNVFPAKGEELLGWPEACGPNRSLGPQQAGGQLLSSIWDSRPTLFHLSSDLGQVALPL